MAALCPRRKQVTDGGVGRRSQIDKVPSDELQASLCFSSCANLMEVTKIYGNKESEKDNSSKITILKNN